MKINISKFDNELKSQIYLFIQQQHQQHQQQKDEIKQDNIIDHRDFCKFLSINYRDNITQLQQQDQQDQQQYIINFIMNLINYFTLTLNNEAPNNSNKISKACEIFKLFLIYLNNQQYINEISKCINSENMLFKFKQIEEAQYLKWIKESFDNSVINGMDIYNRSELLSLHQKQQDRIYQNQEEEDRVIKVYNEKDNYTLNQEKYDFKLDIIDEYESFEHPFIYSIKNRWYGNTTYKIGSYSVVPSIDIFNKSFSLYTNDLLDGTEWESMECDSNGNEIKTKVVVYGGGVLCCLEAFPTNQIIREYCNMMAVERLILKLPLPRYLLKGISKLVYPDHQFIKTMNDKQSHPESPYYRADIDISIVSTSLEHAKTKLKQVANQIIDNLISQGKDYILVRTPNSISILPSNDDNNNNQLGTNRVIQLIILVSKSIEQQILFHDIDCISSCYDGSNVYLHTRSLRALQRRTNLISIKTLTHSYSRILKYALRGFNSICYQFCEHIPRCDKKDVLYKHAKELNKLILEKHNQILDNPSTISNKDLLEYQLIDFPIKQFSQILQFLDDQLPGLYSKSFDDLLELNIIDDNTGDFKVTKFGTLKNIQFKNI